MWIKLLDAVSQLIVLLDVGYTYWNIDSLLNLPEFPKELQLVIIPQKPIHRSNTDLLPLALSLARLPLLPLFHPPNS